MDVNEEYVVMLLELGFSILVKRHTGPSTASDKQRMVKKKGVINIFDEQTIAIEEHNDECDEYEELETMTTILGLVDAEIESGEFTELQRDEREKFYEQVVENIVVKLTEDLINDPIKDPEIQLNVLMSCFVLNERIIIRNFRYDPMNHLLWLVVFG